MCATSLPEVIVSGAVEAPGGDALGVGDVPQVERVDPGVREAGDIAGGGGPVGEREGPPTSNELTPVASPNDPVMVPRLVTVKASPGESIL